MHKIHIFHLWHMKDHEERIAFHELTGHQASLDFMLLALTKTITKNCFLHCDVWVKTLYTTLYNTGIFPHCYEKSRSPGFNKNEAKWN